MKKTNTNMTMGMSLGMCIGAGLGSSLGSMVFQNVGIGVAIGICMGLSIGMALGMMKDNAVNEQMENQGYSVKEIISDENNREYKVIIVNKAGEERTVTVGQGDMDVEQFKVGDCVFLNEDGDIEQVYDDND